MSAVPTLLTDRWQSRILIGEAAHACVVRIRQGYMNHDYAAVAMLPTSPDDPVFPTIWNDTAAPSGEMWQGIWTVTGDWIAVPNLESANITKDKFDGKQSSTSGSVLTLVMSDIAFLDTVGVSGLYHTINRGYYSPLRGADNGRPAIWPATEWTDVFNAGYQIEMWEGYGQGTDIELTLDSTTNLWSAPSLSRTFVGWLDECDLDTHPDKATLTCRDGAILLTDCRLMGQNKATEINSPITFADRRKVLGETREIGDASASSGTLTTDPRTGAQWISAANDATGAVEWIEITLPAGFYRDFYTDLAFDGETMWLSIKVSGSDNTYDSGTSLSSGWVNLGLGDVPGTSTPYLESWTGTLANPSRRYGLGGHDWTFTDNWILRLSFTNLALDSSDGHHYAGVESLYAFMYGTDPDTITSGVKADGWILVDDAADVVRMLLLWAGFDEMSVESLGWTIEQPMVFGQDAFFIDALAEILVQGNYLFHMAAPTDHDMSLGVPTFEHANATDPAPPDTEIIVIKDTDLAEALQVKWDRSNLPYVMRYRGAVSPSGTTLFADLTKRFTGTYWPPWSGHDYTNLQGGGFSGTYPLERLGGVRRQFSQTNTALLSVAECLFACILAAIQYALEAVTASLQIPGYPGLALNQQIVIEDEGSGTNSRIWITSIQSDHTLGPNGTWKMTVTAALLDTEDMNLIAEDYAYTYQRYVAAKGST